jgi:nucleotide-binding universal stress UspA family protein
VSYKSFLVCLDTSQSNETLMSYSAELAIKLDATAVGIAVSQPLMIGDENIYVPEGVFDEHEKATEARMLDLGASFEKEMRSRQARFGWHSKITVQSNAQYMSNFARSTDLIVVTIREGLNVEPGSETTSDLSGELVMLSGKPVLLIPTDTKKLALQSALICWKDTRESRRAISDAIPLLQKCTHVRLVEIYQKNQYEVSKKHLLRIVDWLFSHGINAAPDFLESTGNDPQDLQNYAIKHHVDLLVGGAFGHSRIREWMFGGVTRNLFFHGTQCALVSH